MSVDQTKLNELLKANQDKSATGNSETMILKVIRVSDWKPTSKGNLPTKMVITDKGTFWPLASAISNLPTSFKEPVEATAVLTLRTGADNVERLNMTRLEFQGLNTNVHLAILDMKAGTALFASAAGLN